MIAAAAAILLCFRHAAIIFAAMLILRFTLPYFRRACRAAHTLRRRPIRRRCR